jgi:hypothetical protein
LKWKTNEAFRERLCSIPIAVWTGQRGLDSSGPHKIDENGNHVQITKNEFNILGVKDRSMHTPGDNLVAFYGSTMAAGFASMWADMGRSTACRVAYVKL